MIFRAVGVTKAEGYPANLADLTRRCALGELPPVELVRDLDNAYDLNATEVHVEGRRLGWVPADLATHLAAVIDFGCTVEGRCKVAVHPDHPDRPGLLVAVRIETPEGLR